MLDWIATASYENLLYRWRHEQPGSVWFRGAVGAAYRKRMEVCRKQLTIEQAVEISKRVGWDHSVNMRDFKNE